LDHWKKEGFKFDAIYTGYLGSLRQIDIVKEYFDSLKGENTAIIVDPAMADNGKLYVGFDEAFAKEMLNLCTKADITLPNISEAALMLGEEYPGEEANEDVVRGLLTKLVNAGCKFPVITGVTLDNGSFGFIGLNGENSEFISYGTTKVPYKSHGTGDVYASAFTGALTLGKSVHTALKIATDFTAASIRNTYEDPDSVNYAVNFEAEIPYLLKLINEN
jgi:pyridoxine kinase